MRWPRYGLAALGMMLFASAGGAVVYSNGGGPITAIAGAIVDLGNWATTTTAWNGSGAPGTMAAWGISTYNKLNAIASSLGGTLTTSRTWTLSSGTDSVAVSQSNAANLKATVVGSGTAGTPAGGVLTVQGSGDGTLATSRTWTLSGTTDTVGAQCFTGTTYAACSTSNPLYVDVGTGSNLYGGIVAPLSVQPTTGVNVGAVTQYSGTVYPWVMTANNGDLGVYVDGSTFTIGASKEMVIGGYSGGAAHYVTVSANGAMWGNVQQIGGSPLSFGQAAPASSIPVALATGQVPVDACWANQKLSADFQNTVSGGQIVAAAGSGKKIYICSVVWGSTANTQAQLFEGTGSSVCTGGTIAAVFGSTDSSAITASHGMPIPAYGAYTYGSGSATLAQNVTANENICVAFTTTNSPQMNVHITYVVN